MEVGFIVNDVTAGGVVSADAYKNGVIENTARNRHNAYNFLRNIYANYTTNPRLSVQIINIYNACMDSVALYTKYRPTSFASVRGQEHVVSVLQSSVESGRIAHAYLFAGGRGTGKTSMARILAEALGISKDDVYEIDAASNRQVEAARELREGVATSPFNSKYKLYILDEVHMLTKEAFNTLLKTLEEPPAHALFVLATTELDRVPDTIQSRCQVFNFKKPSHEILKSLVLDVAKTEGAVLSTASAELVALMGDGSFRDTLGILQKALASSVQPTDEDVARTVGAPRGALVGECVTAIARGDAGSAIIAFHKALEDNADAKTFVVLLIARARAVLLLRYAPSMKEKIIEQFGEDTALALARFSGVDGSRINSVALATLITALVEMNRAPIPQIPLEIAIIKICETY